MSISLINFCWILVAFFGRAQHDDIQTILNLRKASNDALRNYDQELDFTFMTADIQITTGAGTLIAGVDNLRKYITSQKGEKMYWVRTPIEVKVNRELGLAWETGTWKGYTESLGDKPVVGGNYSAQWTKASGTWLIHSQLFVTLDSD